MDFGFIVIIMMLILLIFYYKKREDFVINRPYAGWLLKNVMRSDLLR